MFRIKGKFTTINSHVKRRIANHQIDGTELAVVRTYMTYILNFVQGWKSSHFNLPVIFMHWIVWILLDCLVGCCGITVAEQKQKTLDRSLRTSVCCYRTVSKFQTSSKTSIIFTYFLNVRYSSIIILCTIYYKMYDILSCLWFLLKKPIKYLRRALHQRYRSCTIL